MNDETCIRCGKNLNYMDIVAHKKFVNRGAEEFMCMDCLARHFDTTKEKLQERLDHFRKQGCTLFPENNVK